VYPEPETPSFRLDLPIAERLHAPPRDDVIIEDDEASDKYRVTRPLAESEIMDTVDIRTFLEHHPVDEQRITDVVKNITQYFEPEWFLAHPLGESGATSAHSGTLLGIVTVKKGQFNEFLRFQRSE
jgi:hypothetical protein